MKNIEVIYAFVGGQSKAHNKNNSLYIEKGVIYSYGTHFPLGIHLGNRRVLVNGNSYSQTTSTHRNALVRELEYAGFEIVWGCTEALQNYINRKIGGF